MNAEVFGTWFANTLIPNLPKDIKIVAVMNNSKYHSRLAEKSPTINMKKKKKIFYMIKYRIEIPITS